MSSLLNTVTVNVYISTQYMFLTFHAWSINILWSGYSTNPVCYSTNLGCYSSNQSCFLSQKNIIHTVCEVVVT